MNKAFGETGMLKEIDNTRLVPFGMAVDLAKAETADEAEAIFHRWRDTGYFVPARFREGFWLGFSEIEELRQ